MGVKISLSLKKELGMANQYIVLAVVFMSLSGAREALLSQINAFFLIVPLNAVFHLVLLLASFWTAGILKIDKGRKEAVIFMGTQKTLPLSVMLQITCFPEYGTALLVCVIHHIIHLMMDSFLSARMRD